MPAGVAAWGESTDAQVHPVIYVQATQTSLDDETAVRQLLVSVPHPPSVRTLLAKKFFGRRWQQAESCDYWLASDGEKVVGLRIRGVTSAQAFAIRLRYDELAALLPELALSRDLLCRLVKGVTGDCQCSAEPELLESAFPERAST